MSFSFGTLHTFLYSTFYNVQSSIVHSNSKPVWVWSPQQRPLRSPFMLGVSSLHVLLKSIEHRIQLEKLPALSNEWFEYSRVVECRDLTRYISCPQKKSQEGIKTNNSGAFASKSALQKFTIELKLMHFAYSYGFRFK